MEEAAAMEAVQEPWVQAEGEVLEPEREKGEKQLWLLTCDRRAWRSLQRLDICVCFESGLSRNNLHQVDFTLYVSGSVSFHKCDKTQSSDHHHSQDLEDSCHTKHFLPSFP